MLREVNVVGAHRVAEDVCAFLVVETGVDRVRAVLPVSLPAIHELHHDPLGLAVRGKGHIHG